jgi:hypothetical protein
VLLPVEADRDRADVAVGVERDDDLTGAVLAADRLEPAVDPLEALHHHVRRFTGLGELFLQFGHGAPRSLGSRQQTARHRRG